MFANSKNKRSLKIKNLEIAQGLLEVLSKEEVSKVTGGRTKAPPPPNPKPNPHTTLNPAP